VIDRQETSCQRQKLGPGTLTRQVRVSLLPGQCCFGAKKILAHFARRKIWENLPPASTTPQQTRIR
jgi:hypothetical protein